MSNVKNNAPITVGMRNIKTAIAATLCALIYYPIQRNPTFACIGAVFGLGSDMENSWLNGGNRLFGTIFGGVLGMLLYSFYLYFYPEGTKEGFNLLILLLLFMGVVALILVSQIFNWPGAIQPGGVMLSILLFNQPADTFVTYSMNRIFDTAIGVVVALIVNLLLPRERVIKWLRALHLCKKETKE